MTSSRIPPAEEKLHERLKELGCLYTIAQLAGKPSASLAEVLQGIVDQLPQAWQHPDCAAAQIRLDASCYRSRGSSELVLRQQAPLVVQGVTRGGVAVGYGAAAAGTCQLLDEEQRLLDEIARQVSLVIERREDVEERERLRHKLLHADRLGLIGQFAAGVAHELNEPLGSILGFAQLLAKTPRLPKQARADVARIEAASLRAREIIRQLMTFARQTQPRDARVDVNRLIRESADLWRPRCESGGIALRFRLDPALPAIVADDGQLRQVLANLVLNAIHAMPDGGTLSIETAAKARQVRLAVRDSGIGIPADVLPRIFDPFFTTKDVDQGTGLGLSLVHGIVMGHGGRVEAHSRPGEGTCLCVFLPVQRAADPRTCAEKTP